MIISMISTGRRERLNFVYDLLPLWKTQLPNVHLSFFLEKYDKMYTIICVYIYPHIYSYGNVFNLPCIN